MADLTQELKTWLDGQLADVTIHTGEDIPQFIGGNFVWFMRSGELTDENLNGPQDIIAAILDIEIVSKDINQCRLLTEQVKYLFRRYLQFTITFQEAEEEKYLASFDIENHDDGYIPMMEQLDEKLHVGSFVLTAYYA
jgi:hypothetical protein